MVDRVIMWSMEDKRLTVEEFASAARLHLDTARRYVREGKIPAVKVGKRYLLKSSDVNAFLEHGTEGGEKPKGE
jgi:excisionase family DNA binding protein